MELEKCEKCGREFYGALEGIPLCAKHYVENYRKDKRFLEYKLNQILDYLSRGDSLNAKDKEFLKEVKVQFPEMAEEFDILFRDLE